MLYKLGADALYFKVYGFNLPLLFEPGEGWHYGCGMDWAGKIVERTNPERLKLGDYMKKYIFDPLGMKSMTFSLLSPEDIRSRIPKLAVRMEDNGISTLAAVWPEDPPDDCGGVGLYGSAEDFMKLLEMLLQKNGEVLHPETIERLFTPQPSESRYFTRFMSDRMLQATMGVPLHIPCQWAFGGLVTSDLIEGRREAGAVCWGGLPNIKWWIDFKRGICGLYTSQVFPPFDVISNSLFTQFEEDVYSKL
ncbi:AmpC Beta-lactamase class C and other penicillin binding protein [Pyrenophora tritici-repentis]|nr:AmpC Beta-lactamase class C and other penicillin binding protein [Pyrenophora tritici-repentis]KAI0569120.1 AmpC Beta-lactamase class C [Pyrenophora tritici-repentis]